MAENTLFETLDDTIVFEILNGTASAEQIEKFNAWFHAREENRRDFTRLHILWQRSRLEEQAANPLFVRSLNALNHRIEQAEQEARRPRISWTLKLRRSMAAAAVVALVLVGAYAYRTMTLPEQFTTYNDEQTAMHLTLPDGSSVWLGARTTLTYDDRFLENVRRVQLNGEAYFDVVHDAEHPFVVNTSSLNIRVLGTVFNVKAYRDQTQAEATLAEGSIALQDDRERNIVRLHPGQQAVYDSQDDALTINDVHIGNMLLLRYGIEEMNNVTLTEILRAIRSQFGVRLIPQESFDPDKRYNFNLQRNAPIEDVVDLLQFVSGCRFDIDTSPGK